jgi:hypothetical protein
MDGNSGIGLEAESHLPAIDLEHGDSEQALGAANDHGFPGFPG